METIKLPETTTIEIDRETHMLIKQYCIINNIVIKDFVHDVTHIKLKDFKQKIEGMKELRL